MMRELYYKNIFIWSCIPIVPSAIYKQEKSVCIYLCEIYVFCNSGFMASLLEKALKTRMFFDQNKVDLAAYTQITLDFFK